MSSGGIVGMAVTNRRPIVVRRNSRVMAIATPNGTFAPMSSG